MSNMNQIASDLYKALTESDARKPKAYDTKAEVLRVENDIVWVKIPGGIDETPVSRTNNANVGDQVMVRVSGGRAWLLGNETSPATDDTMAIYATETADEASLFASMAQRDAISAREDAIVAKASAESAVTSANIAKRSADQAVEDAATAQSAAESAAAEAESAQESANTALSNAQIAKDSADAASQDAHVANNSANAALTQLSVVEDVIGTLTWISEHATYKETTDTEVVFGKLYFTKNGDIYTPVANPTGDPSEQNYYEIDSIDEAVSNYISSHLSLTNDGLWVLNDANAYKILLASDGMKVYNSTGNLVASFGQNIVFNSQMVPQFIGGEDAYIIFDQSTGEMVLGGTKLTIDGDVEIGGETSSLSQILGDMRTDISNRLEGSFEVSAQLSTDKTKVNLAAHVYNSKQEITQSYPPSCFRWYYKTEAGEHPLLVFDGGTSNHGYSVNNLQISDYVAYDGRVIVYFVYTEVDYYIDENGHVIIVSDSVAPEDIGNISFSFDSDGNLIFTYDDQAVADFELTNGNLFALTTGAFYGNIYRREITIYKDGALAAKFSAIDDGIDEAEKIATNYVTEVDQNGIWVTPRSLKPTNTATGAGATGTRINGNGLEIFKAGTSVAQYAETARIGRANNSRFQLNASSLEGYDSSNDKYFEVTNAGATIGKSNSTRFKLNAGSLEAYDSSNAKYFEVSTNGITYGTKTVANTDDVSDAEKVATNYVTEIDSNGIWVTPSNKKPTNTSTGAGATGTKIDGNGVGIYNAGDKKAQYGSSTTIYGGNGTYPLTEVSSSAVKIAQDANNYANVNSSGLQVYQGGNQVAAFGSSATIGQTSANNVVIGSSATSFKQGSTTVGSIKQTTCSGSDWIAADTNVLQMEATSVAAIKAGSATIPQILVSNNAIVKQLLNSKLVYADTTSFTYMSLHSEYGNTAKETSIDVNGHNGTVSLTVTASGSGAGVYTGRVGWLIYHDTNGFACIPSAYAKTVSSGTNLNVHSSGALRQVTGSSRRWKKDIEDIEGAEALYDIQVRQFKYRDDYLDMEDRRYDKTVPGFIAEEVEEVFPIAVDYEDDELPCDWNARYMLPPMLKLIQDQKKEIDELRERIEALERR